MTDTVVAEAPADGALSIEQAADALLNVPTEAVELPKEDAQPEAEPEAEAPSDETETEADPAAEEVPGAETPAEEPEADPPEPAQPAAEAPQFWDAEAKAAFKTLTPDQQRIVAEQARAQNAAQNKAIEEAAQARKAAEGQASKVTQLAEQLNAYLPKVAETFKDRWADHDWPKLAQEDPARYVADRAQYEAEQTQLKALAAQAEEASRLELQRYQTAEAEALVGLAAEHAPELTDPKTAAQSRQDVARYLIGAGYQPDQLSLVSAKDTVIAYKAMKWDQAQAAAKAAAAAPRPAPMPAPAPRATSGTVRPTAAPAQVPSRQRSVDNARASLSKSGSVDDAVALLNLLSKG